jgi:hypothetical protein
MTRVCILSRWTALALCCAALGLAELAAAAPTKSGSGRATASAGRAPKRAAPAPGRSTRKATRAAAPKPAPAAKPAAPAEAEAAPPDVPEARPAPSTSEAKVAPANGAPVAGVVKTEETQKGVKTYTFGAEEVEGRLKSPQILYFLRRVRAEFDAEPLGHRSFLLELSDTRRSPALE